MLLVYYTTKDFQGLFGDEAKINFRIYSLITLVATCSAFLDNFIFDK